MRLSLLTLLGLSLAACTVDDGAGTSPIIPVGGASNQNSSGTPGTGGASFPGAGASNGGASQGGTQPVTTAGSAGTFSGGGSGTAGFATGGSAGSAGAGGGNNNGSDTPAARPLMVDAAGSCECELKFSAKSLDPMGDTSTSPTHAGDQQAMKFDASKPTKGKLAIVLGGIGGGPGPGGIYGYAIGKGYHAFLVATQTNESGAPDEFKDKDDVESNRQVGDARMEAWDGTDRVAWLDVKRPDSIERRTELALKHAQEMDPGADWAYYLNEDGSVRWSDVVMVGYSFGSQTIAMVAKYVRFSRAIVTSGPTDEGFPKATWLAQPSATPLERMYVMVGAQADYPPASGDVGDKIDTVKAAGWLGEPLNVHSGDAPALYTPPYKAANILVLVGQGHSEMCAGDGGNWKGICDYAFNAL